MTLWCQCRVNARGERTEERRLGRNMTLREYGREERVWVNATSETPVKYVFDEKMARTALGRENRPMLISSDHVVIFPAARDCASANELLPITMIQR